VRLGSRGQIIRVRVADDIPAQTREDRDSSRNANNPRRVNVCPFLIRKPPPSAPPWDLLSREAIADIGRPLRDSAGSPRPEERPSARRAAVFEAHDIGGDP